MDEQTQVRVLRRVQALFSPSAMRVLDLPRVPELLGLTTLRLQVYTQDAPPPEMVVAELRANGSEVEVTLDGRLPREALCDLFLRVLGHTSLHHVPGKHPSYAISWRALLRTSSALLDLEVDQAFPCWVKTHPRYPGFEYAPPLIVAEPPPPRAPWRPKDGWQTFFSPPPLGASAPLSASANPPLLWLELPEQGQLELAMEAVPLLPGVDKIFVRSGGQSWELLAFNLRSAPVRIPVSPSIDAYRLDLPSFGGADDAAALPEAAGLSPERATVFTVRADGRADLQKGIRVTSAARIAVPPALGSVPLPDEAWKLGAGWRAFSLSLAEATSSSGARLLAALGLKPPDGAFSIAWRGAPARRHRTARSGDRYPSFLAGETPVLAITMGGETAGVVTVLLTSEESERALPLPVGQSAVYVALEGLAPGPYAVSITSDPGVVSQRLFFAVEREMPTPPPAEVVLEPHNLRLPPGWCLDLRWEGLSRRWLGSLYADKIGHIEPAAVSHLVEPWTVTEPVADLILDAGELGCARLPYDRSVSPEQTAAELRRLLQERGDALAAAQSDVDLTLLLLQPVAGLLGYQVGEPAPFPGGAALRLHTAMRDGDRVIRGPDALLVALRDGLAVGERPLAEVAARWRAALGAAGAQRGLFTTGLLWLVLERDRRQVPKVMSLGSPLHHEALLRFIEGGLA